MKNNNTDSNSKSSIEKKKNEIKFVDMCSIRSTVDPRFNGREPCLLKFIV